MANESQEMLSDADAQVAVPEAQSRYSARRRRRKKNALSELHNVDMTLRYGVLAGVLLAPILAGGVHFLTGVALAALGLGLGVLALVAHRRHYNGPTIVGTMLAAWLFVTAVQLLPIPTAIASLLSPELASRYQEAYGVIADAPATVSMTLSPNRTAMALWHALGFVGLFTAASLHFRERERFAWLVPRLAIVGVLFVFVSVIKTSVFPDSLFGLYTPTQPVEPTPLQTTLINPNHAAGFFGACAPIALGYALSCRDVTRRYTSIVLYLVLSVAMFAMASRGAALAWALGHIVFVFLLKGGVFKTRLVTGAVAAGVLAFVTVGAFMGQERLTASVDGVAAAGDELAAEVLEDDISDAQPSELALEASIANSTTDARREKVAIYKDLGPLAVRYAPLGIGRGAFAEVYPSHAGHGAQRTFTHAENEYLEFLLEYGPLVGGVLLLALLLGVASIFTRTDWRDAERPLIAGLLTAIAFIAVQNVFDFGLRFPGVGFLLAVCLGAMTGRAARYNQVRRERRVKKAARDDQELRGLFDRVSELRERALIAWYIVFAAVLIVATVQAVLHLGPARAGSDDRDIVVVKDAVDNLATPPSDPAKARAALLDAARPALLARPVDAYLRLLVGIGLLRTGEGGVEAAQPWLELARNLNPGDHRVHLLLGRVYAVHGDHKLAALSFASAAGLDGRPSRAAGESVAELLPGTEYLADALSPDSADWTVLGDSLIRARRFDDALVLADELEELHPEQVEGVDLLVRVHLALGIPLAAVQPANRMVADFPHVALSYLRRSQVALAMGEKSAADKVLSAGIEAHPKSVALLFARLDLLLAPGGQSIFELEEEWRTTINRSLTQVRPLALSKHQYRPRYHLVKGDALKTMDKPRQALRSYEEAHRLNPKAVAPLAGMITVALSLGDVERAESALEILSKYASTDRIRGVRARIDARVAELERQMMDAPIYMGGNARTSFANQGQVDPLSPTSQAGDLKSATQASRKGADKPKDEAPAPESEQAPKSVTPDATAPTPSPKPTGDAELGSAEPRQPASTGP